MTYIELKRMGQVDLIKLIDTGRLIPIEDIRPDNSLIVDMISQQGYCVVSNKYIKQCISESKELADIKASNAGYPVCWEEDL